MKYLALGLCLAALSTSALAKEKAVPAPNSLTASEKAAGWKLLFDGKSTAGWRGFKQPQIGPGWKVEDGVLFVAEPKVAKDVITAGEYENFELSFDWKIAKGGNSGVMFHVIEVGDETYESGPEYQLLDNRGRSEPPLEQAGGLFALYAPSTEATHPAGEWNHARILVDHNKVQHWVNGVKVTEYEIGSPEFTAKVAASKFKRWPQFATGKTGHIALQNHGDDIAFRAIKIRVLR